IILLGLEKSQLVVSGEHTILAIGEFTSPNFIVGLVTLFLAIFLYIKNIPANFLITMISGTALAYLFGTLEPAGNTLSLDISEAIFIPSFSSINMISFWFAVFLLSMILIFHYM